ncbi:hypothetical protein FVF58_45725 [Paraburkholderia panacisoli]|uniref:Uncharacterized protein n=1 Tax=Paraburkholderia panacisoli TaxID=2603818 RepID=A0A5B0G8C7_9BURK|nr:hypothetical protein [Paraburkholderia panacisoli]KAA0998189.1 hypothetical protein FVF58_45725 [Paraburkholderia panacisoli]
MRFALGLLFVFLSLAAYAVTESDLLPVNEAFPLTGSVSGPQQVTLDFGTRLPRASSSWTIASRQKGEGVN